MLGKPDMNLEALTKLVVDHEAMELIKASITTEPAKPTKPVKLKEEALPAAEKEKGKKEAEKTKRTRKKLPDEA